MIQKNKDKEFHKSLRVVNCKNTGTITHKDKKHPSRQDLKREVSMMTY